MKRVLIITSVVKQAEPSSETGVFVEQMNQAASEEAFAVCATRDLLFSVHSDGSVGITLEGSELHTLCDAIHLRNASFFTDYANAIRLYTDAFGIELVNRTDALLPYYGKVSQGFLLAAHGISTPALISSFGNDTLLGALSNAEFDFPMVIKHNHGKKGLDNYLVQNHAEADIVLAGEKQGFVAQPFIANGGELRILCFGDGVEPLIFKKQAPDGEYLNNTSRGGSSTVLPLAEVDPEILDQAFRAAQLMGRDIGGIDVLLGDNGHFYILEVNPTPAIASGVLLSEKQRAYAAFFSGAKRR